MADSRQPVSILSWCLQKTKKGATGVTWLPLGNIKGSHPLRGKTSDVEFEDGYRNGFISKNTVIQIEKFLLLSIAIRWIRMICQVGPSVLWTQKERHLHQILNSLGSEGCLNTATWVLRNFVSLCVSNLNSLGSEGCFNRTVWVHCIVVCSSLQGWAK